MKVLVLTEARDAPRSITAQRSLNPRKLKVWSNPRSHSLPQGYKKRKLLSSVILPCPCNYSPINALASPSSAEALVVCIPAQKHRL